MIDFYTWAAPNGQRVAIMLEECGLVYRTLTVDLTAGEHRAPAFLAINPLGVVPVIADPDHPGLVLTQSTAILLHLARKTGRFLPDAPVSRARTEEALMLVMTDVAAAAVSRFLLTRLEVAQPRTEALFRTRLQNFLAAVEARLKEAEHLAGDYSVADIALYPLSRLPVFEDALAGGEDYPALIAWRSRIGARPAVVAGMRHPAPPRNW